MEFLKTFFIFIILSFIFTPIGGIIYLLIKFLGKGNKAPTVVVVHSNGTTTYPEPEKQVVPKKPILSQKVIIGLAVLGVIVMSLNAYFMMMIK